MLTPEQEAAIRARLAAATPGPWEWNDCDGFLVGTPKPKAWPDDVEWIGYPLAYDAVWWAPEPGSKFHRASLMEADNDLSDEAVATMHLVAHAPTDIAALLAEIDSLREQLRDWRVNEGSNA